MPHLPSHDGAAAAALATAAALELARAVAGWPVPGGGAAAKLTRWRWRLFSPAERLRDLVPPSDTNLTRADGGNIRERSVRALLDPCLPGRRARRPCLPGFPVLRGAHGR